MKRIFIVVVFVSLLVISCAGEHPQSLDNAKDELGGTSVTLYTEKTEIFMEYPALVINDEAKFLIHITDLKDFKAVKQGVLTAEFINDNGEKISIKEDKPARAGIYIPTVIFKNAGNYQMVITLVGNQVSDKIIVENVNVYTSEKEVPSQDEEVNSSISFLKEQQWKIDFANEPVIKRKMQQFVVATGELQAKPELFSKVVSPIQGIVLSKNNRDLKTVGSFVKKGEYLLNISPSSDASENIQLVTLRGPIGADEKPAKTWTPDGDTIFELTFVDPKNAKGEWVFSGNALAVHTMKTTEFTVDYKILDLTETEAMIVEEETVELSEEIVMEETIPAMEEPTGPTTHTVDIPKGTSVPGCEENNSCYLPADITVNAGDTVEWINIDTAAHTVTGGSPANGPSGVFDSSLVMASASYAFTFNDAGSYDYFCMVHPWMVGSVTVN